MKLTHLQPNIIKICNNNEANFPHNLLLTDKQVSSIRKAFAFNSSVNIKFTKIQLFMIISQADFLINFVPLGLTTVASAAQTRINEKNLKIWNLQLRTNNTKNTKLRYERDHENN